MKRFALAAVGLLACASISRADVTREVALAAGDPAKIPEMVKTIGKENVSEFVSRLIKVLAAKPAAPEARVLGLVDPSKLVFSHVPQDSFADSIVASTTTVPFPALPEWTRLCKTTTKAISVNMSDTQYDSIVNKVIKDIAGLSTVTNENKAVVTICALELLARPKSPKDEFAWLQRIKGIPEDYRQDVLDGYQAMSRGDYSSVFGDTKIIRIPGGEGGGRRPRRLVDPEEGPRPPDPLFPGARNLPDTKLGEHGTGEAIEPFGPDRPSPTPAPVPPKPPKPHKPPRPPKPVIPEPYRGQF